jgi:hypothetical protein
VRAPWLEPHDEFEGVGAHELNDRYDPVDERAAGFTVQDTDPLLMHTPALIVARRASVAATRLDGADISHHQYDAGPVSLIRTRHDPPTTWFATKVTQSTSYLDPTASASRTAATDLRVPRRRPVPLAELDHRPRGAGGVVPGADRGATAG